MINENKEWLITLSHHCMAVVGGFMGGYAILTRGEVFGNALTANLIGFVHAIFGRNLFQFMIRLFALLVYFLGTMGYVLVKNKTDWNIKKISLYIDFLAVVLSGFIPASVNPHIALLPVFFAMSFQWNAFPGNYGYASSTIFSTNNVKQTALAFSEYICDKDKQHLHKMWFYIGSLLCFHGGVAVSYFASKYFGIKGIWLNGCILFFAGILVCMETSSETKKAKTKLPVRAAMLHGTNHI